MKAIKMFIIRHTICRVGLYSTVIAALLFLLILVFLLPVQVSAQEGYCDPYLDAPADHPYGYRIRGNRCEGVYIKEVSSTTLLVASLIESFEDYDLASSKDLLVEWAVFGDENIRLRAQGLRRRLYYRMDTVRPLGSTSYTWPSNILAALSIPKKDIGVVAWTQYTVDGTERSVYLPLRISQQGSSIRPGNYQLVLLPGRELREVFISVAEVGEDGHPKSFLQDGKALRYGFYPAERGITIPIAYPEAPGIYYLEIGATLRGGGATTVEIWFYHSGKCLSSGGKK